MVGPGAHDEAGLAGGLGSAVQAKAIELVEGLGSVEVVPAAHDEGGDGDVVPVGAGVDRGPVGVGGGHVEPVVPEFEVAAGMGGDVLEREDAAGFGPVFEVDGLSGAAVDAEAPVDEDAELEGAAGADEAGEVVDADGLGGQAGEAGVVQRGAEPLDGAQVGAAGHADAAVAPGLLGDPGLGVEAVLGFGDEGGPGAVGVPAAADVLDDAGVAVVGEGAAFADVLV